MDRVSEHFKLTISTDLMTALLDAKQSNDHHNISVTAEEIKAFLISRKIIYGHIDRQMEQIANGMDSDQFPIVLAKGKPPINGDNGRVEYIVKQYDYFQQHKKRNFREIMSIPSVEKGDKIAYLIEPTLGEEGLDILGNPVAPKPGKPVHIRAGKNIKFVAEEKAFYATDSGQIAIGEKDIHVYPLYEVGGDLTLQTGNIHFVGSVTIHGNVPTGYTVDAEGDIKIYGLVESAFIKAGGSVYIAEGIVGLKKGTVQAGLDIKVGYSNQGMLEAGRDIVVENAVIHSSCVAKEHIYCQKGNIIGGILSAGKTIEARDIGNKMNTKTELALGINKKVQDREKLLYSKKKELLITKQKLQLIGDQLNGKKASSNGLTPKERILLLKQRYSMDVTVKQMEEIEEELSEIQVIISDYQGMKLIVRGTIYPNVELTFDKYKRKITSMRQYAEVFLDNREITIQSL